MPRHVDALTAPTLKHLREHWWDSDFSEFLRETLRPRPGTRILDVGCGDGTAELSLGRLQISQVSLYAVDIRVDRAKQTHAGGVLAQHPVERGRGRRAVAAVCQRRRSIRRSASPCCSTRPIRPRRWRSWPASRKPGGRVVAVEPDNAARYWFSSLDSGRRAYEIAGRFFSAFSAQRGNRTDLSVGPKLPGHLCRQRSRAPLGQSVPCVSHSYGTSTSGRVAGTPAQALASLRETLRQHREATGRRVPGVARSLR